MPDSEPHCPFLNRADRRCSTFFSIEQLQHAFEHCFHAYKACSVYQELLVERQARRSQAASGTHAGRFVWATACASGAIAGGGRSESHVSRSSSTGAAADRARRSPQFVQVRIPSLAAGGLAHAQAGAGADGYAKPVA